MLNSRARHKRYLPEGIAPPVTRSREEPGLRENYLEAGADATVFPLRAPASAHPPFSVGWATPSAPGACLDDPSRR